MVTGQRSELSHKGFQPNKTSKLGKAVWIRANRDRFMVLSQLGPSHKMCWLNLSSYAFLLNTTKSSCHSGYRKPCCLSGQESGILLARGRLEICPFFAIRRGHHSLHSASAQKNTFSLFFQQMSYWSIFYYLCWSPVKHLRKFRITMKNDCVHKIK